MHIDRIDHVVLTVRDVQASCAFYQHVLGMRIVTFEGGRKALAFGNQKFNLHQAGREFEPKADRPTPGSADFCLITTTPMAEIIAHLQSCSVAILEGPGAAYWRHGTDPFRLFPRPGSQPDRSFERCVQRSRFRVAALTPRVRR
jgi:catechol 2,3-dioxygenase-like lactoylglutathione lyase family enzyme